MSRNFHLVQDDLAFVILLLTLQDDLNCRILRPVAQLPVHPDVLVLPESQETALNAAIEDAELSALLGIDLRGGPGVLHDLPEWTGGYMG